MKILLIDPPFKRFTGLVNNFFPVGLSYVAAAAHQAGHEPVIYDADAVKKSYDVNFTRDYQRMDNYVQEVQKTENPVWSEIAAVIEANEPDVVGIGAITTKIAAAYRVADIVKKVDPRLPVIMGGAHPTARPAEVLGYGSVDYVIRDEGEQAFVKLLAALNGKDAGNHGQNTSALESIPNLSWRKNGALVHNPSAPFVRDLDSIPFPLRTSLTHLRAYSTEDLGVLLTSRGCPFRCSYCYHPWQGRVNFRSAENVLEEILDLYHNHGVRQFAIKDDTFTVKKKHVGAVCDAILREKIKICWDCTTRPNLIDRDLLDLMISAGCTIVKIGVETGSQKILDVCNRGTTFAQVREAARLFNERKIFWSGYFMMGLPQESEEDILATLSFMHEIRPYYAGLGVYEPFPNTTLFDDGVKLELLHEDVTVDHYFSTNPKDYYFKDPRRRVLAIEPERFERLVELMTNEFHKHNSRPRAIMRRGWARRLAYRHDISLLSGDVRKAVSWFRPSD